MANEVQFWLSFGNGAERLQLPVNPPSVRVSSPYAFNDYNVSQLGEYTVIGDRLQKTFEFSSIFPKYYNHSYCEYVEIPDPWEVVEALERWRDSRRPMRLTITGTPINYAVTLREFTYEPDKAGSPGDIYYTLSFKQFTFIDPKARP